MATGITGDDCRIALAAVNAGVRIIEVNHPSVSLCIGPIMGQSFRGEQSGRFSGKSLSRLKTAAENVRVPVFAEGGVTDQNIGEIRDAGAHVAVVGTFIDDVLRNSIADAVRRLAHT